MQTALVAFVAQIDLQGVQGFTANGRKVGVLQKRESGVHEVVFLNKKRSILKPIRYIRSQRDTSDFLNWWHTQVMAAIPAAGHHRVQVKHWTL
jgi:hypothetical protein